MAFILPARPSRAEGAGIHWSLPELAQLVAPVALYPDALMIRVLTAGSHPLDIAEAASGTRAPRRNWDPSVKALLDYPQVLDMMNANLSWAQRLGSAYKSQPGAVDRVVQLLRAKALVQGTASDENRTASVTGTPGKGEGRITIRPSRPGVIRVPEYDPTVAYGAWPYPLYPPYVWHPPRMEPGRVPPPPSPAPSPERDPGGEPSHEGWSWPGEPGTGRYPVPTPEGQASGGGKGGLGSLGGVDPAYPRGGYRSEKTGRAVRRDGSLDRLDGLYPAGSARPERPASSGSPADGRGIGRMEGLDPGETGLFDDNDSRLLYDPPSSLPSRRTIPEARGGRPGGGAVHSGPFLR